MYKLNKISLILIIIILFIIASLVLYNIGYICPIKKVFNIYCAGCGTTRMIISLLKLDIYQAFRYNSLMFILGIIFLIYIIYVVIMYLKNKKIYIPNYKVFIAIIILILLYMILRNIPYFEYLKPTIIIK